MQMDRSLFFPHESSDGGLLADKPNTEILAAVRLIEFKALIM